MEQSSGLIIEADVRSSEGVVYPVSSILSKDVLDKTQRQLLVNIAKDLGMAEAQLLNAPPWTAALTIQLALVNKLGYVSDKGVDMHLIGLAEKKHLPVLSLESVQFQIDLIAGQPNGGQEMLLSSIDEYEGGDKLVQCLIESWKSGDGSMLEEASLTDKATEDFNEAFLYSRNRDWAKNSILVVCCLKSQVATPLWLEVCIWWVKTTLSICSHNEDLKLPRLVKYAKQSAIFKTQPKPSLHMRKRLYISVEPFS